MKKVKMAIRLPRATIFVNKVVNTNAAIELKAKSQSNARLMPKSVATPLPPLPLRKGLKQCPKTAANPAKIDEV